MKSIQPRRIVTPHIQQPGGGHNLWVLAVGLLGLVLWTWQVFEAGRGWAGYDFERSRAEASLLQARVEELEASVAELRLQAASHARASQIDRDAVRQAQASLAELQAERSRLSKEVALLRGLLSAGRGPLHIRDFSLTREQGDKVRYRFTVAQALRNIGATEGKVRIKVAGKHDGGKADKLDLAALSEDKQSSLKMRFMHYQDIEGVMQLPKDFQPESVTIELIPKNKGLKRVSQVFQWQLADA